MRLWFVDLTLRTHGLLKSGDSGDAEYFITLSYSLEWLIKERHVSRRHLFKFPLNLFRLHMVPSWTSFVRALQY